MKRVKAAFDPHNLLNPGKIFPHREQDPLGVVVALLAR